MAGEKETIRIKFYSGHFIEVLSSYFAEKSFQDSYMGAYSSYLYGDRFPIEHYHEQ
jgi:hypothetical protein